MTVTSEIDVFDYDYVTDVLHARLRNKGQSFGKDSSMSTLFTRLLD